MIGPAKAEPWRSDAGAALVTVLVMLAVIAVLATALVEAARFSLARLDNQRSMDQARWYLLGAERLAADRAGSLIASFGAASSGNAWEGQVVTYPIEGGAISLAVWDGSNCFNLNGLVMGGGDAGLVANPMAQVELARLIGFTGATGLNSEGLAAALADYLDEDQTPLPGGAEDAPGSFEGGYRTANTLIGDVSELRRVRGFTPEIVAAVAPFTCVRPVAGFTTINVNTLRLQDAPLLAAMFGDGLSLSAAQSVIAARPATGWSDVEGFFAHPSFASLEISDAFKARFAVRPRFVVMTARVRWDGVEEASAALIEIGPPSRIVRRVIGAQASERSV